MFYAASIGVEEKLLLGLIKNKINDVIPFLEV
jgi:hypothetical protein